MHPLVDHRQISWLPPGQRELLEIIPGTRTTSIRTDQGYICPKDLDHQVNDLSQRRGVKRLVSPSSVVGVLSL